jgi:predicted RNase H-like HicB family nuclease
MARTASNAWPVDLEQEDDGGYVAALPDIGYGATQGDSLAEALAAAEDMLGSRHDGAQ